MNKLLNKSCIYIIIFHLFFISCQKEQNTYKIYLKADEKIINQKQDVKIFTSEQTNKLLGNIKTRGGFSINFPKKSYEINLNNEVSLLGLPKDDDWILNANFIDKTFLRHVISYEIFQDMSSQNIAPNTRYTELFINNKYEGLYVLMEKLDKSTLGVELGDSLSFIFKDPHIFRKSYSNITPQKENNFHQQTFPKIEELNQHQLINKTREFILNSNDSIFTHRIGQFFDINNIIDWHILLLITNNSDGILKNFYLYKINQETPIRISPWDYDHSFGRDGDNELNLNTRKVNLQRSILFDRLLKFSWYNKKLKKRWIYLKNKDIISAQGLKNRIKTKHQLLIDLIDTNNQKWPTNHPIYYDHNNINEELQIMYDFIDEKHIELDKYFESIN